jgi:predicted RNA-binding protein with RPS1 domain
VELVHILEIAPFRANKVNDIIKEGDIVSVDIEVMGTKPYVSLSVKKTSPNFSRKKMGNAPKK